MTLPDGKLKAVYKKGDKFCDAKKVKGKKTFTPIESQPENVIELVRNFSVLKKDATYRRRVSWLGIGARESIALVEYFGKFPGLSQHGNGKEGKEYIRTPASVMTEMSDMLKRENPLKVYNKHDELSGPSSRKQVHDKKYNDKKKERKDAGVALAITLAGVLMYSVPSFPFPCCDNPGNLPKYSTNAILSRAPIPNQDTRLL
jgi:hypothetical protein